jgi:hypothetical protein
MKTIKIGTVPRPPIKAPVTIMVNHLGALYGAGPSESESQNATDASMAGVNRAAYRRSRLGGVQVSQPLSSARMRGSKESAFSTGLFFGGAEVPVSPGVDVEHAKLQQQVNALNAQLSNIMCKTLMTW